MGAPVSAQTDIYALGIILFEMVAGRKPFVTDNVAELLVLQLNTSLPSVLDIRPDTPEEVDDIIQRATSKEPEDRYKDAIQIAHEFRRAISSGEEIAEQTILFDSLQIANIVNPYKRQTGRFATGFMQRISAHSGHNWGRPRMLERLFKLSENKTTARTEILAGITTFLTMAYIIFVNPDILSKAGMPHGAVFVATCLAAAIGTALMAFIANYPIALAPGMGLNAYFAFTVVLGMKYPWQVALGCVFLSGVLFFILSVLPVREWIVNAIPRSLKMAIGAGIGLFLAIIALQSAKVVVPHPATMIGPGKLTSWPVILGSAGFCPDRGARASQGHGWRDHRRAGGDGRVDPAWSEHIRRHRRDATIDRTGVPADGHSRRAPGWTGYGGLRLSLR